MKKTILIVDDSASIRSLAKFALIKEGYDVIEAIDGKQGLYFTERYKDKLNMVVSDLNMPFLSGLDMVKEIRKNKEILHLPIIMLTMESHKDVVLQAKDLGVSAWIIKPFVPLTLINAIKKYEFIK